MTAERGLVNAADGVGTVKPAHKVAVASEALAVIEQVRATTVRLTANARSSPGGVSGS